MLEWTTLPIYFCWNNCNSNYNKKTIKLCSEASRNLLRDNDRPFVLEPAVVLQQKIDTNFYSKPGSAQKES